MVMMVKMMIYAYHLCQSALIWHLTFFHPAGRGTQWMDFTP